MTPAEWFAATDAAALFAAAPLGARRTRLFLAACLRRHWDAGDDVFRDAVAALERYADNHKDRGGLAAAKRSLDTTSSGIDPSGFLAGLREAAAHVWVRHSWRLTPGMSVRVHFCLHTLARSVAAGVDADLPGQSLALSFRLDIEQRKHAELFRCVVPPPGPRPAFDPRWLTASVVGLAQSVYDRRAFDDCPILADAFEDAGCDDAALLAHLRGVGPHGRGCWPVDLALGRDLSG